MLYCGAVPRLPPRRPPRAPASGAAAPGCDAPAGAAAGHRHNLPIAQPVGPVDHHALARLQPVGHLAEIAIGRPQLDRPHADLVVRPDDVGERARRTALDAGARDPHDVVQCLHQDVGVDELVGKQRLVAILKQRPRLDRARGGVHLVVQRLQKAGLAICLVFARSNAATGSGAGPCIAAINRRQRILRHGEDHRDRLQLGHHHQPGRIARLHVIALVHLAQPHPAGHRRGDVAVDQVQLGAIHRALVGFDGALILPDQRRLGVQRLARQAVLRHQLAVAGQIKLRVLQQGLVMRQRALGLLLRHLVGARIDLRQEIALLHDLPFGERHIRQLAVDLRLDGHRLQRRHRAELAEHDPDVARPDRGRADGLRRPGIGGPAALRRLLRRQMEIRIIPPARDQQDHDEPNHQATQPARTGWRRRLRDLEVGSCGLVVHACRNPYLSQAAFAPLGLTMRGWPNQ